MQLFRGQEQAVAHSQLRTALPAEQPAPLAHVDNGIVGRALRLAVEEFGDSRHGVKLEGLIRIELELHIVVRVISS